MTTILVTYVCLPTLVKNLHVVSHFKNETFTALQYAQDFGTILKESLKKKQRSGGGGGGLGGQILHTREIVLSGVLMEFGRCIRDENFSSC